jgi:hypothetical protein
MDSALFIRKFELQIFEKPIPSPLIGEGEMFSPLPQGEVLSHR